MLTFDSVPFEGKTLRFRVLKRDFGSGGQDLDLGTVQWYAPWRRYCFYPSHFALFDASCLREITAQLDSLMEARKPSPRRRERDDTGAPLWQEDGE
jgi:hypothetical protein